MAAEQATCRAFQARQVTFGGDEVAPDPVLAGGFCTAPVPTWQVDSGRKHCNGARVSSVKTTDGQCDINAGAQRATSDDRPCTVYLPILARSGSPDDLLSEIENRAVVYFWQEANPETGLIKDRANNFTSDDYTVSSTAAVGFGLAGLAIGDYRGWLTHEQAYTRTLTTLRFLRDRMPNERGFYYHFVDYRTGERVWNSEVSSIDTAWLLAGVLLVGEYYAGTEVATIADELFGRVDFQWMLTDGGQRPTELLLNHGWTPEGGFLPYRWDSYNELMLLYLLAIGSPTRPISADSWQAWSRPRGTYAGYETFAIGPLFTHQFSQAWVDFRNRRDWQGYDYWQSSVNATLANRQFCIDNMDDYQTYDTDVWGLTASDGPNGYRAYSAPPGTPDHDGTVSPAAPAGSIVFTPQLSSTALHAMFQRFGDRIWGRYGFSDAFNVDRDWWDQDVIGIDLGISLLMIENYRSGFEWRTFERNEHIQEALRTVGLTPATAVRTDPLSGTSGTTTNECGIRKIMRKGQYLLRR